jgi:hypothetical protein
MLFGRFRNRDEAHTAPDPADRKVNNSIVSSATSEPAKRLSAAAFPGACFPPRAAMPVQLQGRAELQSGRDCHVGDIPALSVADGVSLVPRLAGR